MPGDVPAGQAHRGCACKVFDDTRVAEVLLGHQNHHGADEGASPQHRSQVHQDRYFWVMISVRPGELQMATDLSVRMEQSNRRTSAPGSPQGDGAEIKEESQQQPGQRCAGEAEIRAIRSGGWRLSCALSTDGDGVCRDAQKVQAEKMDEEEPSVLVHPREPSQEEFCDPLIL